MHLWHYVNSSLWIVSERTTIVCIAKHSSLERLWRLVGCLNLIIIQSVIRNGNKFITAGPIHRQESSKIANEICLWNSSAPYSSINVCLKAIFALIHIITVSFINWTLYTYKSVFTFASSNPQEQYFALKNATFRWRLSAPCQALRVLRHTPPGTAAAWAAAVWRGGEVMEELVY